MANTVPTLTGLDTSIDFLENTVNATPQVIDADVVFTDPDGNFDGGTLTVSGLLAEDSVSINDQGAGAGEIGFSGGNVTFGGTLIGTAAGGAGATLTITFNAAATTAAIDALIQNLTYANTSDTPTADRTLEIKVVDADGAAAIAPITFAEQTGAANPFDGAAFDVGSGSTPSFADLDGDGDLDAVVGEIDGNLNYFENTGTATSPVFTVRTGAANPFDGAAFDVGSDSTPSFADLDGDGDLDAVVGEIDGNLNYFENTGTAAAPLFTVRTGAANPFDVATFGAAFDVGGFSAPTFADLDGDGDLDAVVGEIDGNLIYFENTGSAIAPAFTERTGADNPFDVATFGAAFDVGILSKPSFADFDGDGDLDAIVGENGFGLNYFENTGSATEPLFVARTGAANPFDAADVGANSAPSFADLDGDGDLDAVVGEGLGTLDYFENTTPPAIAPDFVQQTGTANPFDGAAFDVGSYNAPAFADLDGDGDLDVLVGEVNGGLRYFRNDGTAIAPTFVEQTGAANPFDGAAFDVGDVSTPTFVDLDGDGDLDAVVGEFLGNLNYFENTGTATAPVFALQTGADNPFDVATFGAAFDVGSFTTPSFADLDGDGDLDAVVGEGGGGELSYFENTGTATAPAFTVQTGAANPFDGVSVRYGAPSFADLDGDGDLDAIVGDEIGAFRYFENTGTAVAAIFTERTGAANPFDGIDVNGPGASGTAKPAFADLDGDGDLDLVAGEFNGTFHYFRNTGAGFELDVHVDAQTEPQSTPVLAGLDSPVTFDENTVNAAPGIIDAAVVFTDADGNFDGGTLTVSGLLAEDSVSINDQGAGAGEIGFSGGNVTFGGTLIGTAAGGAGATLTITFNAAATTAAIDALIQNLTYANTSDTPTADRTLEIKVVDADGAAAIAPITFAEQTGAANPFDGAAFDVGSGSTPSFVDLDGDGDLDAVVGEIDGNLNYFENTGTATSPVFTVRTGAANPFDGAAFDVGSDSTPSFADLDGDGDLDAVVGEIDGNLNYFENTGTAAAPLFTVRTGAANPFDVATFGAAFDVGGFSAPTFADLDGDGDLDAVVGEIDGNLIYFENTGSAIAPAFTERTGADNPFDVATFGAAFDVGILSKPSFADFDGDGDLDAIVGENGIGLNYFENTGSVTEPLFVARTGAANPFDAADVGANSAPSFADLDGDGDLDAVVGEGLGTLDYFENTTPPAIAPDFVQQTGTANPLDGFVLSGFSEPSFADLDGDGDLDAIVGENSGAFRYFENTGSATAPVFGEQTGAANPFDGIDVGGETSPSFADLDGDGDLDAVVGESDGTLNYFMNTGTVIAPAFTAQTGGANPFNGVDVGISSTPSFADLDGDGDLDAVVGEEDGVLNYFMNTGTATAPVFAQQTGAANPFNGIDVGFSSAPSFVDLDGDGDLDAVVGDQVGSLNYFENTGSATAPAFTQRTGATNPFNGIDVDYQSSPSFADLDGDGDLDAVVGDNRGNLHYFRNTGAGFELVVDVTAQDDAPVAHDDNVSVAENGTLNGDVFADNDDGPDADPDGGPGTVFSVTAVNGNSAAVGSQIVLPSGALLTLNADGTFRYDPNHAFDTVPAPGSGASNTPGFDDFSYTITGGSTATVVVAITGVDSDDVLEGTPFPDTLNGGLGADTMSGDAGDDIYFVDNSLDQVVENPGEGSDIVYSAIDYTIGPNVEAVVLIEGAGALDGAGNGADNALIGNSSNNALDGLGGNDYMVGGGGDDIYVVDSSSDEVVESPDAVGDHGGDIVYASIDYTIGPNVEALVLVEGAGPINAAGNGANNALIGNSENNALDGRGGNDYMVGGAGNDVYVVDTAGDAVVENPGAGADIVYASVDYTIGANVEALVLIEGAGNINGSGSNAVNALIGNSDDNVLDGKGANDFLVGKAGNDTFVFAAGEANGDLVSDFAGNGAAAGDSFRFVGFGSAAGGATFTQIGANQWQIHSALDGHNEVITLQNSASVDASDFIFV